MALPDGDKKKPRPRGSANLSRGSRRRKAKSHHPGALTSPQRPTRNRARNRAQLPAQWPISITISGSAALSSFALSIQAIILPKPSITSRLVGVLAAAIASVQRGLLSRSPTFRRCERLELQVDGLKERLAAAECRIERLEGSVSVKTGELQQ